MKINENIQFSLTDEIGKQVTENDCKGKWLVLYFYPKDDTPGCTIEAKEFTILHKEFKKINAIICGVSADAKESHCKFRDKHELTITLLSDPEKKLTKALDLWKEKTLYGKKYFGIERTTLLINPEGKIVYIWNKVKPEGHAQEVLSKVKEYI